MTTSFTPPIGEPESLGELARLVSYSFATVSNTLAAMNTRLDGLVSAERHRSDVEAIQKEVSDLKAARVADQAKALNAKRWTIGTVIAALGTAVPSFLQLIGKA